MLFVLPFAAKRYDDLFRRDPAKALRLVGLLILPVGILPPIQYFMPNAVLFTIFGMPAAILLSPRSRWSARSCSRSCPYRLRGHGLGARRDLHLLHRRDRRRVARRASSPTRSGPRAAVLVADRAVHDHRRPAHHPQREFIQNDLSLVVAELREEMDEHERQQADPEHVPALQVDDIDFSYGPVQVLFDVGFEVRRGEVLALLGTNGAGKSTILRAIAGLGTPARGVVRLHGRTITYISPEQRVKLGIRILPGGKGVFPPMTVRENLEMAPSSTAATAPTATAASTGCSTCSPTCAGRQDQPAGSLSGGQQQMLALAMALLHDPEVLLIDELSLGLAPVVVQELLQVVERLKAEGMTIIIVEQSLNVALAIADRAVFLEKGQVRFEGPAETLRERDDLAPCRVPRDGGRLTRGRRPRSRASSSSTASVTGWSSACSRWASCSSTGRRGSSTSPSATWASSAPACSSLLVVKYDVPVLARRAIVALVVGTLFGAVIELDRDPPAVLRAARDRARRHDRRRPAVAAIARRVSRRSTCPAPGSRRAIGATCDVAGVRVTGAQLAILVVVPLVAVALGWFLNRTLVRRSVKASAENPDLARLAGHQPEDRVAVRVGGRRRSVDALDVADRRTDRARRRTSPRSARTRWCARSSPR